MPAGGFTACEEETSAKLRRTMVYEMVGGVDAVIDAGGPGILGSKAVAYGEDGEVIIVGHVFEVGVLAVLVWFHGQLSSCSCRALGKGIVETY